MKSVGRFLPGRMSSLVRGLLPVPVSSLIVRKFGSDPLSRRDVSTKFLSDNLFEKLYLSISILMFSKSRLVKVCLRLLVAPDELYPFYTSILVE